MQTQPLPGDTGDQGEFPPGCTDDAIELQFSTTPKIIKEGQTIEVLEALFVNPSDAEDPDGEPNCAFETTNVEIQLGNGDITQQVPECNNVLLLPGDILDCKIIGDMPSHLS